MKPLDYLILFVAIFISSFSFSQSNSCFTPTPLTISSSCSPSGTFAYTTAGATQSYAACSGVNADDDVWFKFVATGTKHVITVYSSASFDAVVQLYSGSCGTFTSLYCEDINPNGGTETIYATGLVPGTTYLVRVYHFGVGSGSGYFNICITNPVTNDEPCNAIALPAVTSTCNFLQGTTIGAFASTGVPTPASCAGGTDGGFTSASHDVWYTVTVPASGNIYITPQPNYGITDGAMALYSGTCGSLTQISCSDDNAAYPGTSNDAKPYISATGYTAGTVLFLRYWASGTATGNFGLCVSSPTNDDCTNALYICDLNGYSASTSAAYTADRPDNMRGNAEEAGTYTYTPGVDQGGIFGYGYSIYDVEINNNSWIKFTAASATATLGVSISNCWNAKGIQMQIFSGTNCSNFVPVSAFQQSATGFTITANGLTVGQTYYLMVDGYAGDVCNYTITANSGVLFPAITAAPNSICLGASTTLTAPVGATSYSWAPGGQTTQQITVSPNSTTTYTCTVGGVCGYVQQLTKTITVNSLPAVVINAGNPVSVCNTQSVTLTATGANSYVWNTGSASNSISVSPTTNTTYTVTGTNTGTTCSSTSTVNVTVLSRPVITVNSPAICSGLPATLTANGAAGTTSYTWSNGTSGTNTISVSPGSTASYTVTGTGSNGCTNTAVSTVSVNSLPSVFVNSATICNGLSATLTASGGATTSDYSWSNGSSGTNVISVSPSSNTSYTVTGTGANGCSSTAVASVNVHSLPAITVNSGTICDGQNLTLTAGGGNTYSWSTGATGPSINVNPSSSVNYTVTGTDGNTCTNTAVAAVTVNNVPVITTSPTSTPSNCGQSTGALTGAVAAGSGTLSYSWTNSSNSVVGTSADLVSQPAGVYNLTVSSSNGCSSVFGPFNITNPGAPPAPTVTSSGTSVCVGASISLSASSTFPSPAFNWTGPNSSGSNASLNIPSATLADGGIYTVTVTSNNCTSPPFVINITVNPLPLANATNVGSPYCSDSTISLVSSGGNSYSWAGPGSFTSVDQNPVISQATTSMTGTYTVTVTDNNGCAATATSYILVNQTPPNPVASSDTSSYCEGESVFFTSNAAGATSYSWSGPNGFISSLQDPVILNSNTLQSGIYSVTASGNGCSSAAANVVITVNVNPSAIAADSTPVVCSGNTIYLLGNGGSVYNWTGPNSFVSGAQNPVINNSTLNAGGAYDLIVTNASGCADTASISITVNPTPPVPVISVDPANICVGDSISFTAVASGATAFNWTGPNGFVSSVQNPSIVNSTITNSGMYSVVASTASCSSVAATVNITVFPNPIASATANTSGSCTGDTINLTASGGGTYSWIGPGGFSSANQNPVILNSTVASSGTYTVTVTNGAGCLDSTTVYALINPAPAAPVVVGDTTCSGDPLLLSASGPGIINWYSDATLTNLVLADSNFYSPALADNTIGTYYVTSSENGCSSGASVVNAYNYNIVAGAFADPVSGFVPLNVFFSNTSSGVDASDSYLWNINGTLFSTAYTPSHIFETEGNYIVMLVATDNESGCTDTTALSVSVDGISYTIPNIFTPNDDNDNDWFTIISHGLTEIHVIIYDRWGLKMFEFDGVHAFWDGRTTSGVEVPDGTYFYLFNAKSATGKEYQENGHVMLMR